MLDGESSVWLHFNFFFFSLSSCAVYASVHFLLTSVDVGSCPYIIILLSLTRKNVHINPENVSYFRENRLH